MKDMLTAEDALPLARAVQAALQAAADEITGLDAQMGDGDLGVTCRLGMAAIVEGLPALAGSSLDQIWMKSGMAFNSAGASTYGALVATAGMQAAKYAKAEGLEQWDLAALAAAAKGAAEGIEKRGKASRGQKTMLDALWPAAEALQAAHEAGASLAEAFARAARAAEEGMLSTTPLKASYGRAAWLQDQTIGVQDPGATVVTVVFKAVAEYVGG